MKALLLLPLALSACATAPDDGAFVPSPAAQAVTESVSTAASTASASVLEVRKLVASVELTPAARLALDGHLDILESALGKTSIEARDRAAALTALADVAQFKAAALAAEQAHDAALRDLEAARSSAATMREERDQARKDREAATRAWRDRGFYALALLLALAGVVAIGAGVYLSPTGRRLVVVGIIAEPCAAFLGWVPQFLSSEAFRRFEPAAAVLLAVAFALCAGYGVFEFVRWVRRSKASRVAEVIGTGVKAAT